MTENADKTERPVLTWPFPLPRTHTGILLGNGVQGLMVWGDQSLNITVGRSGFWDHRFGNAFSSKTNFKQVRSLLEAGDEKGLRQVFAVKGAKDHPHARPHQLGGGRLELHFTDSLRPKRGELYTSTATLRITLNNDAGDVHELAIRQAVDRELAWVEVPESLQGKVKCKLVPSWAHVGDELEEIGCEGPTQWLDDDGRQGGFVQPLPEDDPLALGFRTVGDRIIMGTALGEDAKQQLQAALEEADIGGAAARADTWWREYWQDVPRIELPDPDLQHAFDYGLYKQAGLTPEHGIACTLQGPWLEEYRVPPWSCDYHFNINIQMIYWPALPTNRAGHFQPLWDLIQSWFDQLKRNGESFFGAKGALMLPHAVDDRCQVVGTFWTGTIDHACTAWMAQMAYLHYRYTMDEKVLREIAWPLLIGAFEGYWAMCEWVKGPNGAKRLSLPVSVSPEFKGARMDAWGRDASFQLAAWHATTRMLFEAADILGEEPDKRWKQVRESLPDYTTITGSWNREHPEHTNTRIALWEGMDLIESHRHHSHLGSIHPFCTVSIDDEAHQEVICNSLQHWTRQGPGTWSGWCIPWAATIHARCNNADAAVAWLRFWKESFTNEGHGTLHDARHPGVSNVGVRYGQDMRAFESKEVMQADAGMGALNAICELLVQNRRGVIHVLPGIPRKWRSLWFEGIRAEGGFLISAWVSDGRTQRIEVVSEAGGRLKLAHGLGPRYEAEGKMQADPVFELVTTPGQRIVLERVAH